ncbi:MAG: hypothetical protein PHT83_02685 [Bacilli bacterium]|nr:hypothetical protein [Bacilli bacterium]
MKKIIRIMVLALLLVFVVVLSGCTSASEIQRFEESLTSTVTLSNKMDHVDIEEIEAIALFVEENQNSFIRLSTTELSQYEEDANKIMEILEMRNTIKEMQLIVNANKEELKGQVVVLRSFVRQSIEFTSDERLIITASIAEALELRDQIKATIGEVYEKIKTLNGSYSLENIDLIYSIYNNALNNMDTRVNSSARLIELANGIIDLVEQKLE